MKSRIISFLIILSVILSSAAACSSNENTAVNPSSQTNSASEESVSTGESASSEDANSTLSEDETTSPDESESNPPDESESNSPQESSSPDEETDFFTKNGQGVLPEEINLPSHYLPTDEKYFYKIDLPLPDAEGYSVYEANNILLMFYWGEEDQQYCDMISLTDCSLIKRIPVSYDSEWGQFPDGGFWLVDRTNLTVRFYDTEGNETLVKEGDTSADFIYCEMVYITDDKKYMVTAHNDGAVVEMYDLSSGEIIKPVIPSNMTIGAVCDVSEGLFFDGGYGLGVLYNPETGETENICSDVGIGYFYGDIFDCITDGYIKLGTLHSDEYYYIPFEFDGYLQDMDYGCAITSEYINNKLMFWDLRSGVSVSMERGDEVYGFFATFLGDGTALVFEYGEDGAISYIFDLVSAFKDSEITTAFTPAAFTDAELKQIIETTAETIYDDHGVELIYGSEGNDFVIYDYVGVAELDLYKIHNTVITIKEIFNMFPDGMLREAYSETDTGFRLYLCGDIYGVQSGSISTAGGVTTEQDGYIAVVLDIDENLWYNIPHEFSHVFDNRIQKLSINGELDWISIWDSATPVRHAYVYSYDDYTENYKYTMDYDFDDPDKVWFIDGYARTFPTEDRARLFEYMCISESDAAFRDIYEYENLMNKARLYCYILRQCFPSCNTEEPNPWERNLGIIDASAIPNYDVPVPVG